MLSDVPVVYFRELLEAPDVSVLGEQHENAFARCSVVVFTDDDVELILVEIERPQYVVFAAFGVDGKKI